MKRFVHFFTLLSWLLCSMAGYTQSLSGNTVNYKVTYDAAADRYTAWVVPNYKTPNTSAPVNNTTINEYGGTAQFTLKVPNSFSVIDIQDVNGSWEKAPVRLGPGNAGQSWSGIDPAYNYYVIGKSPTETNYGPFAVGIPVALFTFRGNGCVGPVSPLPPGDSFISAADSQASLNVANSFYSRSGQPAGGNVVPLEQFVNITGPSADCRPLLANADALTLTAGTSVTLAVLANDTSKGAPASLSTVTVGISSPPAQGTAVVNANGTISYTPPAGLTGVVSFTYTICDVVNTTLCAAAPVSLTILPAPVVRQIFAYDDNGVGVQGRQITGNVLANDDLGTGTGPLVASSVLVMQPAHGTVSLNSNGIYTYTPIAGFTGTDSFVYQVCDSGTPPVCATSVVTLKVQPATPSGNNPPVALSDNVTTKVNTSVSGNVLINDSDPDAGQVLTVNTNPVTPPAHGSLTLNSNGTFSFKPDNNYTGTDYFIYQVCDNGTPQACDQARVKITVYTPTPVVIEPIANADLFYRNPGQAISGNVLTNDSDPNGLPLTVLTTPVSAPQNGSLVINNNGTFTYTPNAGFTGDDKFYYQVCNSGGKCNAAPVFIVARPASLTGTSDLLVRKSVSVPTGQTVAIGSLVSYTVQVSNQGPDPSTGVVVTDQLPAGLSLVSAVASQGNYVATTGEWGVGSLTVNQSATLLLTAKVLGEGVILNSAAITKRDQIDPNSDNDTGTACVSIPITICGNELLELTIPAGYQQVQWFYNGQPVQGVNGTTLTVSLPGQYTFQAMNTNCPQTGCCPIIVVPGDCCKPVCVPVQIVKRRK